MTNIHAELVARSEAVQHRYDIDITRARRIHEEHGIIYADILADELEKKRDRELSSLVREYIEEKESGERNDDDQR